MFQKQGPGLGKAMRSKKIGKKVPMSMKRRAARALWVVLGAIVFVAIQGVSHDARAAERAYGFAVAGVVSDVAVKQGQKVSPGDVLLRLDDQIYKARVKSAKLNRGLNDNAVILAQQNYDRIKQRYDALSASGQALEQADVRLRRAKRDQARADEGYIRALWNLDHATLKSPVSGKVKRVMGYRGLVVDPGALGAAVVVITTP